LPLFAEEKGEVEAANSEIGASTITETLFAVSSLPRDTFAEKTNMRRQRVADADAFSASMALREYAKPMRGFKSRRAAGRLLWLRNRRLHP